MSLNRRKASVLAALGLASMLLAGVLCCARSQAPAVQATPPREDVARERATVESEPATEPRAASGKATTEPPGQPIDMEVPEEPQPRTPSYIEIVDDIKPGEQPVVWAEVVSPTKLVIETDNVQMLRVTREGTSLSRTRSIVLRIDGQGIEWTPKYIAVELERSPAGEWTVVRRRPVEP